MTERQSPENKEANFHSHNLTPFEHLMIGSTSRIEIGESIIIISSSQMKNLLRDEKTRRILFSPIFISESSERKRTIDSVKASRERRAILFGGYNVLELDFIRNCRRRHINTAFSLGELDKNGQVHEFEIFFIQSDQKLDPEDVNFNGQLNDEFKGVIKYAGKTSNSIKFKIEVE